MFGFTWIEILLALTGLLIIVFVIFQSSKSDGASGVVMGGGLNLFEETKERGIEKIISNITMYLGFTFILLALITFTQ